MRCDVCGQQTWIIYIDKDHRKICDVCRWRKVDLMLKIVRLEEAEDGTFGALLINAHVFCVTLEPPDKDNQKNISNIPPGKYTCKRINSPKYGDTFEITGILNRSHILFHSGNVVSHTKGCVLIARKWGVLKGDRAGLNSGNTFREFLRKMVGINKCELEIMEV